MREEEVSFIHQTYKSLESFWWFKYDFVGSGEQFPQAAFLFIFFYALLFISGCSYKDKKNVRNKNADLNYTAIASTYAVGPISLFSIYTIYLNMVSLKDSTVNNIYLRSNNFRDFQIRDSILSKYKEIWNQDDLSFFDNINFSISHLSFNKLIITDHFGLFMQGFLLICVFLFFKVFEKEVIAKCRLSYTFDNVQRFYLNFILVAVLAIFFLLYLISAYDLISLFVALEGSTLCLYVLAGLRSTKRLSVESGLKYFLTSAVFSCMFGFGAFLLYLITGSTNFYIIREVIGSLFETSATNFLVTFYGLDYALIFAVFLIVVVFLMKLGAVPYHFWIGDVYQGAPLIVTAFFSTVVRVSFFAIFFRLVIHVFYFMEASEFFMSLLYFAGCFSVIFGSILALTQFELKRFLAYSSIVHTGFILIGLSTMTIEGFKSAILYTVVYIFTLLCFFLLLFMFPVQSVQNQNGVLMLKEYKVKNFSDLQNLPMSKQLMFIFFLFSMAGLPPFPGFIIKLYVFKTYLSDIVISNFSHYTTFGFSNFFEFANFFMYVVIVLVSLLTAFNYTRLITKMSFTDSKSTGLDKFLFNPRPFVIGDNNKFYQKFWVFVIIILNLILISKLSSFYSSEFMDSVVYSCYHPFLNKESLTIDYFIAQASDSPIQGLEVWFRALPYDEALNPHLDDKFIKHVKWVSHQRRCYEIVSFDEYN
jgi:NADH-quinone oxidoreductase subunit N